MSAKSVFDRLAERPGCRFHVEISPLLDETWTGIPVVAANLARELLLCGGDDIAFFHEGRSVAPGAVAEALRRRTGVDLRRDIESGRALTGRVEAIGAAGFPVGLYPSVKRDGGLFASRSASSTISRR
jgi:hypothetical protein